MADYKRFGFYHGSDRGSQIGTALTFLVVGLGIGALSALLFAPDTGKHTRRQLRRKCEDAMDVMEDWVDQAGDVFDRGVGIAKDAKERVAPITERLRRG